jgi:glycosyltransferase involved in cell wall biosynthesis
MKRILIAHAHSDIVSGAEKAILDMILPLKDIFQFIMIIPKEGHLSNFYRKNLIEVWIEPISLISRLNPIFHIISSLKLAMKIKSKKVDLIIFNNFGALFYMGITVFFSSISSILYVREYFGFSIRNRFFLKIPKCVFAVSEDVKHYMGQMHFNIKVVHDFINSNLPEHNLKNEKPTDKINVLLVGRISRYKQQDLFINSFIYLGQKSKNIHFYIVGSANENENAYFSELIELVSLKNIGEHVHFLGNRNDVIELLKNADLCCMVSDREPFPRVILEAQLCDCPVLASNTGGAIEMIEEKVTGFFFDANKKDPRILAAAIVNILNLPKAELNEIVLNAKKKVMKTFASTKTIENFKNNICNYIS